MMKLLAALFVGVILAGCSSGPSKSDPVHPKGQVKRGPETDPVCGMNVDPSTSPHERFQGKVWYFCSEGCETQFRSAPAAFVPGPRPDADIVDVK
jgi:YHS domain-containing protein